MDGMEGGGGGNWIVKELRKGLGNTVARFK